MKSYNSYKSSEIDWIDQIPSHWSEKRIKYLFSEKPSTQNTDLNSGSISFGSVVYKDDNSIPESTKLSYQEVLVGEFLVNPLNLNYDLKSLRTALSDKNVVVSQGYIVLRLEERETDQYFFKHLLRVFDVEHMKSLGSGVRQTISFNHLGTEALPLPPIKEQKAIASFLDTKTSLIDSLIEKTQRKIELFKEKRTSLINEVVTKGLNPNVEMKDSGVEWIGEIPSHWGRTKLKRYVSIFTGYSFKSDWFGEEGIPVIRISNIQDGFIDFTKSVYLTEDYLIEYPDYVVKRDDTLICLTGSLTGKVGKFNHEVGLLNQRVGKIIVRGNKVLKGFIDKVFFFQKFQGLIKEMGEGISENFPNVSHLDVVELEIPIPPISEQQQIVQYLDEQTQKIDKTIAIEEERIDLLKEYRQSLISNVVTGKIKVTEDA